MTITTLRQRASGDREPIAARLLGIERTGKTPKGKPVQRILVGADDDNEQKIDFFPGNNPAFTSHDLGKKFLFSMWAKKGGKYDTIYVNAFLDNPEPIEQAPTDYKPPETTNTPDDMVRIRSMGLSYAKDEFCAGAIDEATEKRKAIEFTDFIMTGKWFDGQPKAESPKPEQETQNWEENIEKDKEVPW